MGRFIVGLVVVVAIWTGIVSFQHQQAVAPFESKLPLYMKVMADAQGDVSLVKGKRVLPMDVTTECVDDAFFALGEAVKPTSPNDVGAIARIAYRKEAVGEYRGGAGGHGTGYVWLVDVQLVDLETRKLVASSSFRGSMPRSQKKGSGGRSRCTAHKRSGQVS